MGSQPKHGTADTTLVTQLSAATFPSLLLGRDDEVSLLILQKHAEVTISMQSSHKGLWKVTRLLNLISANSKILLGLFLRAQNITEPTLLECRYPDPPFPDIQDSGFPKDDDDLQKVMDFEAEWFSKFHDAIAFDSVQSLMEDMANVRIGCIPGEMISTNVAFKYTSDLVIVYQDASEFTRKKCDKSQLSKAIARNWWESLRQIISDGKVEGEDWQAILVRFNRLVAEANKMVSVISALTCPKPVKTDPLDYRAARVRAAVTAPNPSLKRGRESEPHIDRSEINADGSQMKEMQITCIDCSTVFPHSISQQQHFKSMNFVTPKRCKTCSGVAKDRYNSGGFGQQSTSGTSDSRPKAGMPEEPARGWGKKSARHDQPDNGWGSSKKKDGN